LFKPILIQFSLKPHPILTTSYNLIPTSHLHSQQNLNFHTSYYAP